MEKQELIQDFLYWLIDYKKYYVKEGTAEEDMINRKINHLKEM